MTLPHVVSALTKEVYKTCQPMRISNTEKDRKIIAEDFEWDEGKYPDTLVRWAIMSLTKVFQTIRPLDQILPKDFDTFMEYYPPDINFKYTVPIIQDEHYWKRAYKFRWPDKKELHSVTDWKNRFLSALLQEYLENASADVFNVEEANELATLVHSYVKTLTLTQLQIVRKPFVNVETVDSHRIEDCCPFSVENIVDHVPLQSVLEQLIHLEELSLTFGVNNLQNRYEKRYFEFSHGDCNSMCSGLKNLKKIRILRINRSSLDCSKVRIIMRQILEVESLEEIDFSHCLIGDIGALAIGGYLQEHPNLKILRLCNNRIGDLGYQGIAYSIQQNLKAPLDTLDLRLNYISLVGAGYLASALVRCKQFPTTLNIAACGLVDESAKKMVSILTLNRSLCNLDLSSNNLHGMEEDIMKSLIKNRKILKIDLRCTGINEETLQEINEILDRNINLVGKETTASSEIPPLYLNEPEYLIWDYNPNNPDYEPGHYPERTLAG